MKTIIGRTARRACVRTIAGLFAALPLYTHAYSPQGHQIVGAIADQLLSPATKAELQPELDAEPLKVAGPWADCAKSVYLDANNTPGYATYPPTASYCTPFEAPEFLAEMEAYVQANCGTPKPIKDEPGHFSCPLHGNYHFTDVSVADAGYSPDYFGTGNQDIVATIDAIISYLENLQSQQHRKDGELMTHLAPPPYDHAFASRRQAIWLLTHLVGDLHQPLHVGAAYLEKSPTEPGLYVLTMRGYEDKRIGTVGGNAISDVGANMHTEWDDVSPLGLDPNALPEGLITAARRVSTPTSDAALWPSIWASQTLRAADSVFAGTTFRHVRNADGNTSWGITYPYEDSSCRSASPPRECESVSRRNAIQRRLLVEAGAHLAQILNALYGSPPSHYTGHAYLTAPQWESHLPLAPDDPAFLDADRDAFFATRPLIGTKRGDEAMADDVYNAEQVAARFDDAYGQKLTEVSGDWMRQVMANVTKDEEAYLAPIKHDPVDFGRPRPLVAYPNQPGCPITFRNLVASGSYPSGHGMLGWLWANVLSNTKPERATELKKRGWDFGNSRVVCGYHYPSDVEAGRLAADELLEKLRRNPDFVIDVGCAGDQLAGKVKTPACTKRWTELQKQATPKKKP